MVLIGMAASPYRLAAAATSVSRPGVSTSRSSNPAASLPKARTASWESTSRVSRPSGAGKECSAIPAIVKAIAPLGVSTESRVPTCQSLASARLTGAITAGPSARSPNAAVREAPTRFRPPSWLSSRLSMAASPITSSSTTAGKKTSVVTCTPAVRDI